MYCPVGDKAIPIGVAGGEGIDIVVTGCDGDKTSIREMLPGIG